MSTIGLKRFDVVPSAGDTHHAMRISPERLMQRSDAEWVDVAQG